jgi:hypothetical protein
MSISASSKWFVAALLAAGLTVAALFVYVRWQATSIDGFYEVKDSFIDASGDRTAAAYFVKVEAYDTSKIVRVGAEIAAQAAQQSAFAVARQRTLLIHFYEGTDTAALTDVELDELAYTNPEIVNARGTLQAVRRGYVMSSTHPLGSVAPAEPAVLRQATFYMPRPGIKARDIR